MSRRSPDPRSGAARACALWPITVAALVAALALALGAGAHNAQAASAKACPLTSIDQEPAGGRPQYNLSLKVLATPCAVAVKVMRAYHKCRARDAFACTKSVLSAWRCTAKKTGASTPLMFYASYTCRSRGRLVTGSYQQNT